MNEITEEDKKDILENKDSNKEKNNKKNILEVLKNIVKKVVFSKIFLAVIVILMGALIVLKVTGKLEKIFPFLKAKEEYTYTMFMKDVEEEKVEKVTTISDSRTSTVVLKTEKQIEEEKKIKEEYKDKQSELKTKLAEYNKTREDELNKLKEENFLEYQKYEKELLENRTKRVYVPTVETFTKLIQENIQKNNNIIYEVKDISSFAKLLKSLFGLLPTIILAVLVIATLKMQGLIGSGLSNTQEFDDSKEKVLFEDIAGLDEEKEQLIEVVEFLKDPKKFKDMGAKIPRGILLYGEPGTGKTLIAKAIAGEADTAFFPIGGSEFIEMFAGLGAQRVRKLFDKARKLAPSIIFIDEIDAVGSRRTNGGNDGESNQTLNQLLVEMDGFKTEENVIVIAATNRPEMLDKALLRPGRFDRQIVVSTPDVKGREEILNLHGKNKKFDEDVDFTEIAKETAGFTGAELSNILNEAAILATKQGKTSINHENIEEALRKVTIGLEKQNRIISDREKKITAYHEGGHAIVSYFLETQEDVKEVTIIPRGMAGGYTMYKTSEDKSYLSKKQLEEDMISLMGGRAAEEIIMKDITSGASNDIERASKIARLMITHYGMSNKLGPISLSVEDPNELHFYGQEITKVIGEEIREKVETAYILAKQILLENMDALHDLANTLLEKEKINEKEFKEIMLRNTKDK